MEVHWDIGFLAAIAGIKLYSDDVDFEGIERSLLRLTISQWANVLDTSLEQARLMSKLVVWVRLQLLCVGNMAACRVKGEILDVVKGSRPFLNGQKS